jgi:hypothetical protein
LLLLLLLLLGDISKQVQFLEAHSHMTTKQRAQLREKLLQEDAPLPPSYDENDPSDFRHPANYFHDVFNLQSPLANYRSIRNPFSFQRTLDQAKVRQHLDEFSNANPATRLAMTLSYKQAEELVEDTGLMSFLSDMRRVPCFRKATLWGIGLGTTMAGHSFYRRRSYYGAILAGGLASSFAGLVTFMLCRRNFKERRSHVRLLMETQRYGHSLTSSEAAEYVAPEDRPENQQKLADTPDNETTAAAADDDK